MSLSERQIEQRRAAGLRSWERRRDTDQLAKARAASPGALFRDGALSSYMKVVRRGRPWWSDVRCPHRKRGRCEPCKRQFNAGLGLVEYMPQDAIYSDEYDPDEDLGLIQAQMTDDPPDCWGKCPDAGSRALCSAWRAYRDECGEIFVRCPSADGLQQIWT
jgi:hypothetical protein